MGGAIALFVAKNSHLVFSLAPFDFPLMRKLKLETQVILAGMLGITCLAAPPAEKGKLRGPLPDEQRAIIQTLAKDHKKLTRKVELIDKGYVATTTSEDKQISEKLKAHFRYMKKRLDSGAMVRRWDPAYAEMTDYYDKLEVKVEELPNGLKVTILGKTPEAVKVARNHASIVTKFVKEGEAEVQKKHSKAN